MKRTRFDGTETNIFEKISKLVSGKDSSYSRSILQKICMNLGYGYDDSFLQQVDAIGLYGQRIYMLYEACKYNLSKTEKAVIILYERKCTGGITQDEIVAMKEQSEFDELVATLADELIDN